MNWYDKQFPTSDDRPGCWLRWLAETDEEEALLYRHKEQMKQKAKSVRAAIFLAQSEGSVEAKKAATETDERTEKADVEHFSAEQSWRELHNKRDTVNIAYEAWRTMRADQRATAKGM